MKLKDIILEDIATNDPEWDLVTLLDVFKAHEGIDVIPYDQFLKSAQEEGYDVDKDWMEDFLSRQKEIGIISDYDMEKNTITIDGEEDEEEQEEEDKKEKVEDAADNADEENEKKKEKVEKSAVNAAKSGVKKKDKLKTKIDL